MASKKSSKKKAAKKKAPAASAEEPFKKGDRVRHVSTGEKGTVTKGENSAGRVRVLFDGNAQSDLVDKSEIRHI